MILAAGYARTNKIPFLGICLGMQMAIVEFARNVIGYADANSSELNPETKHPVVDLMPDQNGIEDLGGTLRLGTYPCVLDKRSKAYGLYGTDHINERHRHRYEVNNDFRKDLTDNGMILSGLSPDGHIVEMIELSDHPFFVGIQAHPEFKSRPNHAHPLFAGFVESAEEQGVLRRAKKLLMKRNHLTEPEAHRYLQKTSMDTGRTMMESAHMVNMLISED
jgi:CTP synthase